MEKKKEIKRNKVFYYLLSIFRYYFKHWTSTI